jgi:hypothetical protein
MTHKTTTLKHIALLFIILFLIQCPVAACNNESKPCNHQSDIPQNIKLQPQNEISQNQENDEEEEEEGVNFNILQQAAVNFYRAMEMLNTAENLPNHEKNKQRLTYLALENYRIAQDNSKIALSNCLITLFKKTEQKNNKIAQEKYEIAKANFENAIDNKYKAQTTYDKTLDPQTEITEELAQEIINQTKANFDQARENYIQIQDNVNQEQEQEQHHQRTVTPKTHFSNSLFNHPVCQKGFNIKFS